MSAPQPQTRHGVVKRIVSGDTITVRGMPKGGPPPEKTITLCNIMAPKLARKGNADDEPYAFEAREYLRKKLIGQDVIFTEERTSSQQKIFGNVWLGKDTTTGQNIAELLVSEGLVHVKRDNRNQSPELQHLQDLENSAKSAGKGLHNTNSPQSAHKRNIIYVENDPAKMQEVMDKVGKKPVKAIVEFVHDGSTLKVLLLPDFYHITLAISGIRCPRMNANEAQSPSEKELAQEAQFFTESRLLQRDVEVILESTSNYQFVGSVIHPKGNIAEALLAEGFAKCVDWSMRNIKVDSQKLYAAEKRAKEARLRRWKDYTPPESQGEFSGVVVEITSADSVVVKTSAGELKKVFLSSIRPPRKLQNSEEAKPGVKSRPLYDIPFMFEAREFLRKKLIRKQVKVIVDYIQPAQDKFPEKTCCTVMVGKVNIAAAMVSKGLATVVRYRQSDDQRSSHYNELREAEEKAEKSQHGLHAKKDIPLQRIRDVSTDPAGAKSHLQALKRAREIKAVVEFVASGSRLKLFVPKEYCLITFLLAGVKVPRAPRIMPGATGNTEGERFGEQALLFTKEHCFQKDVDIVVENMESKGSGFIGWLFVDNVNLSVELVEEGLAEVSSFIEQGEHYKALKEAEERAKAKRLNLWADYVEVEVEQEKVEDEKQPTERKIEYQEVVVSEVTNDLHFYAQKVEQRMNLENMLSRLRQELAANPPLSGAYTPKRGDMAVAKFTQDDQWYRVKIEKVTGNMVSVFYLDYGNSEVVESWRVAAIPAGFNADKPFATQYILACIQLPKDEEYKEEAIKELRMELLSGDKFLLNVEGKSGGVPVATLVRAENKEDVAKELIRFGLALVGNKEKRLMKLHEVYAEAQRQALKERINIWQYGDITEDDDSRPSNI